MQHRLRYIAGNADEVYIELVDKEPLLATSHSSSQSFQEDVCHIPESAVRVIAYPSKSTVLGLPNQALAAEAASTAGVIFRSDSNGEDLQGYVIAVYALASCNAAAQRSIICLFRLHHCLIYARIWCNRKASAESCNFSSHCVYHMQPDSKMC